MKVAGAILALVTAIIMVVKAYIDKQPRPEQVKQDEEEKFREAAATGNKNRVNTATYDHDKRLRNLIERWKRYRAKGGRNNKRP